MSFAKKFEGKVVLITGSGSGIGEETALHLAECGAHIVVTDRDGHQIESVAQRCRMLSDIRVVSVVADLTIDADVHKLMDITIKEFGRLDVLVNSTGIGDLSSMNDPKLMELYSKIFDTNIRCVILLTQLAIPYLEKTQGNVIMISSVAAMKPSPKTFLYCMSKSALDMFTKCLSLELAPKGIRVNGINPSVTETPLIERKFGHIMCMDRVVDMRSKQYPLGRIAHWAYDTADAIEFLASSDASFITGTHLLMDASALFGSN